MTNNQIDKITKPYWDEIFDEAKLGIVRPNENVDDFEEDWYGAYKMIGDKKKLIVGYNKLSPDSFWFSNGPTFEGGESLFMIKTYDFYEALKRYLIKNYGAYIENII